jgi:myo-inositol-1(or 4)-monophosphatase
MIAIIERMSTPLISDTAFWATCASHLSQSLHDLAISEVLPRFERVQVHTKADGSLLSDADLAVQEQLPSLLESIFPAPLLGEEMDSHSQNILWLDHQAQKGALWIADPIDGTTNFAAGLPWFAISAALVVNGVTVLGATVAPALQRNWYASLAAGSFCNGTQIKLAHTPSSLKECLIGVDMTHLPHNLRQKIADTSPAGILGSDHQKAPWRGWRSLGASTLEWCALASGHIQAYVHGGQMPWDAVAGKLIVSEAGGHSEHLAQILDVPYEPLKLASIGYAASAPGVWNAWQQWLRDQQD